jgi:hypothetical protein
MIDPIQLHSYLDGELSETEVKEIEAKLANCQASREELAAIQSVKTVLKGRLESQTCDKTWAACQARLKEIERVEKSGNFVSKYSWAFALGVAMIVVVGGTFSRYTQQSSISTGALAGFVGKSNRMTPEKALSEAISTDVLSRVDANLSRLQVLSGREVVLEGQPATALLVKDANGPLQMLVFPVKANFENLTKVEGTRYSGGETSSNQNAIAFEMNGQSVVLFGQRSQEALMRSADKNFPETK